jgi:hypothetical protein
MSDSNDGHSVSSTPWMQIPPFGSSRIVCNSAKEPQSAGPKAEVLRTAMSVRIGANQSKALHRGSHPPPLLLSS